MIKGRFGERIGNGIFALPLEDSQELIYAPLLGMLLQVNSSYKSIFSDALKGDKRAQDQLGIDDEFLGQLLSDSNEIKESLTKKQETSPLSLSPVTLFLASKCTMSCRYCYAGETSTKEMTVDMAEKIIALSVAHHCHQKEKTDCFTLNIHGRDVGACWPLFVHVIEYAKRTCYDNGLKLQTHIGTNAFYNQEQAAYIAENITSATVSIDGPPFIHDKYRILKNGKPSSEFVIQTLSEFDRRGFKYSVRMTVLDDTLEFLPDSVAYICEHTQTEKIKAEPLYMRGYAIDKRLTPPDPYRFIDKFIQADTIANEKNVELSYSGARLGAFTNSFCSASRPTLGLTPDGYLTCCYEILDHRDSLSGYFIYGQYDSDSNNLTIENKTLLKLRKVIADRFESCNDCFCKWSCGGDCPAKYLNTDEFSSNNIPDRCIITRGITKHQLLMSLSASEKIS